MKRSPCKKIGIHLALGAVLGSCLLPVALADDYPKLRQGLWELERNVEGQKIVTKKCSDPVKEFKQQRAMLEKAGCKFSSEKRLGKSYRFTADCTVKVPSGGTVHSITKTSMTAENDSAYHMQVNGTLNGKPNNELLKARRVGGC